MAFSRRHYRAVSPLSDTPAQIAERIRRNSMLDITRREMHALYPVITAENFVAANDFIERRLKELMAVPS